MSFKLEDFVPKVKFVEPKPAPKPAPDKAQTQLPDVLESETQTDALPFGKFFGRNVAFDGQTFFIRL